LGKRRWRQDLDAELECSFFWNPDPELAEGEGTYPFQKSTQLRSVFSVGIVPLGMTIEEQGRFLKARFEELRRASAAV
jgi:hypothetical protein